MRLSIVKSLMILALAVSARATTHGPTMPPGPDEPMRLTHGPTMPPGPDEPLRIK